MNSYIQSIIIKSETGDEKIKCPGHTVLLFLDSDEQDPISFLCITAPAVPGMLFEGIICRVQSLTLNLYYSITLPEKPPSLGILYQLATFPGGRTISFTMPFLYQLLKHYQVAHLSNIPSPQHMSVKSIKT